MAVTTFLLLPELLMANSHFVCRPAHTVSKANDTVWKWWMFNWWLSDGTVCLSSTATQSCHTHCKTMWLIMDCNSSCVFTQSDLLPLPAHAPLAKLGLLIACRWSVNKHVAADERFTPKSKLKSPYLATSTGLLATLAYLSRLLSTVNKFLAGQKSWQCLELIEQNMQYQLKSSLSITSVWISYHTYLTQNTDYRIMFQCYLHIVTSVLDKLAHAMD